MICEIEFIGYYTYIADREWAKKHNLEIDTTSSLEVNAEGDITHHYGSVSEGSTKYAGDKVLLLQKQMVCFETFAPDCLLKYSILKTIQDRPADTGLADRLEAIYSKFRGLGKVDAVINERCNVTVGNMVTHFNEVEVREDYCSDELQKMLMKGWRIVAVCVQPDQRRPDYVLGRFCENP
jgi:hypothetical protein